MRQDEEKKFSKRDSLDLDAKARITFAATAEDQFKQQGYTLLSVELGGQGSEGNPHDIIVVMQN